jgi:glycosyltransferase involved in cell wall biosynthesis
MSEGPGGSPRFLAPGPRGELPRLDRPPAFSFVIPAYEAASTIGGALESAFAQTQPAHEVIVVDDGSSDDLDTALAPFADRIALIRKPNGGVASARNAGIGAATGDFYAVLDADDRCDPRRLEALAGLASARPDLDLITTDIRLTAGGEPMGSFREQTPFEIRDQRTAILWSCFPGGWPAVRLTRLREVGGFDESLRTGEDWDCWLRLIFSGSMAGLVEAPYYDYAVDSAGLTADRVASLWDRVALLEKAAAGDDLTPAERRELTRSLRYHRSRAARTEVQAGLAHGGSRRRAMRLALMRGVETRTRLRCLAEAASR